MIDDRQVKSKSSWYGTWPRKSTASTQVARETILADKTANGGSSTDVTRFEPKKSPAVTAARPPSMYLGKSKETLDITMGGTFEADPSIDKDSKVNQSTVIDKTSSQKPTNGPEEAPPEPLNPPPAEKHVRPATSSGWLGGWLNRPAIPPLVEPEPSGEICETCPEPSTAVPQVERIEPPQPQQPTQDSAGDLANDPTKIVVAPATSSSWFGLWSTAAPSTATIVQEQMLPRVNKDEDIVMKDAPEVSEQHSESVRPVTGSSWAFWSTETPKKSTNVTTKAEKPEIPSLVAIAGDISQEISQSSKTNLVGEPKKTKSSKRVRAQSNEVDEATRNATQAVLQKPSSSQSATPAKVAPPNLLLPSVKSTYRLMENPSILQQITRLLLHGQQQPVKHVYLVKDPPKIKKALAIGIHGLFPAPLLRTVIGQPTGTSIRFANHASDAIRRWADKNGSTDCEIEKVALEGEGKIAERVDNLWKLLLNWIDHVRKADFVLIGCHSQGVPVALMLVAKLIEFGVVTTGKIGVCAMGKLILVLPSLYKLPCCAQNFKYQVVVNHSC
jgi:hypothetical protein